jgi:urease subunit gamma/beta
LYLNPTESDRLTTYLAASLAREATRRGLLLSLPEAVAVIADTVHWAARSGASYEECTQAGACALTQDQVLPGVAALLEEVRVEPLFDEGTRLVVIRWPLGRPSTGPGELSFGDQPLPSREAARRRMTVVNTSPRVVRVSSHYPFHLVNRKLSFDRPATRGWRLDLAAGAFVRWAPGQSRTVDLVPADRIEKGIS